MKQPTGILFVFALILILLPSNSIWSQGESWERTHGPVGADIKCLTANGSGAIFAGTRLGVFSSRDHGTTWHWINSGIFGGHYCDIQGLIACSDSTLVAGGANFGVYYTSDNNGGNWVSGFQSGVTSFRAFSRNASGQCSLV